MQEIEVKFLDIDPQAMEAKLTAIGATKVGEYLYRIDNYDYPDLRLDKAGGWIRVRDEGERIAMAFKQRLGITSHDGSANDTGMEEIEFEVSDFDKACEFLRAIGMQRKVFQEKKRIRYTKDGVEFDLDFWPLLEPYLEIEAKSWEDVDLVTKELGLNSEERKICSANQLLKIYGINTEEYWTINFDEVIKK